MSSDLFEIKNNGVIDIPVYKKDVLGVGVPAQKFYPHIHCKFDFGGVYLLFYENELQYIGSSLYNVGGRLRDHVKTKFFEIDAIMVLSSENCKKNDLDIRDLEAALIIKHQPKYNVIGKSNSGRYRGRYKGKKVTRHEQTLDF